MEEGKLVEWQAFFVNFIDSIDMSTIYDSAWLLGSGLLAAVGGSLWLISGLTGFAKEWVKIDDAKFGQVLTDFMISGLMIVLYGFIWWIIFQVINLVFSYAADGASIHSIFRMYAEALKQISSSENWFEKAMPNFNVLEYITFTIYFVLFLGVMVAYAASRIIHGLCLALAIIWGAITIPTRSTLKLMPSFWKLVGLVILWPLIDMIFMGFLALLMQKPLNALIASMVDNSFGFSTHILMVLELVMSFVNILMILLIVFAPMATSRLLDNRGVGDVAGAGLAFAVKAAQDQANNGLSQGKEALQKAYKAWQGGSGGGAGEAAGGEASADAGGDIGAQDTGSFGMSFNGMNADSPSSMGNAFGFGSESSSVSSGGTSSNHDSAVDSDPFSHPRFGEPDISSPSQEEINASIIVDNAESMAKSTGEPISQKGLDARNTANELGAARQAEHEQAKAAYWDKVNGGSNSEAGYSAESDTAQLDNHSQANAAQDGNASADSSIASGSDTNQPDNHSQANAAQDGNASADSSIASGSDTNQLDNHSKANAAQDGNASADSSIASGSDTNQPDNHSQANAAQDGNASADSSIASGSDTNQLDNHSKANAAQDGNAAADSSIASGSDTNQPDNHSQANAAQDGNAAADSSIASGSDTNQPDNHSKANVAQDGNAAADSSIASGSDTNQPDNHSQANAAQDGNAAADSSIASGSDTNQPDNHSQANAAQDGNAAADGSIASGSDTNQPDNHSQANAAQDGNASAVHKSPSTFSSSQRNSNAQYDDSTSQPKLSAEEQVKKEAAAAARRKAFMAKNRNAKLRGKQR